MNWAKQMGLGFGTTDCPWSFASLGTMGTSRCLGTSCFGPGRPLLPLAPASVSPCAPGTSTHLRARAGRQEGPAAST